MKQPFRLKVVQDLAQQHRDKATVRLGALNAASAHAQSKLQMLLTYREEYRARFRSAVDRDVHSAAWKNFHQFVQKLDHAIEQQRSAFEATRHAVNRGQHEWQKTQVKVEAYGTLEQRHDEAQAERARRSDQRVMDEFAARARNKENESWTSQK